MKNQRRRNVPEGFTLEPPDGGYAWIILFGVFLCIIMTVAVVESLPVIFKDLIYLFETNTATMSWLPAIVISTGQLAGPLSTVVVRTIGFQRSVILGSLITAIGMMLAYFARHTGVLIAVYSITGPGMQFCVMSFYIILSQYFKKYFKISMGVLHAGIGSARLFLVPITQFISNEYGPRAVFLIMGATLLHGCILASIFKPVDKYLRLVPIKSNDTNLNDINKLNNQIKNDDNIELERRKSVNLGSSLDIFLSKDIRTITNQTQIQSSESDNGTSFMAAICHNIDYSVLRETNFYFICANSVVMLTLLYYVPFFLYPLGIELGFNNMQMASVVIARSISNIAGKFLGPVIMTMLGIDSSQTTYIIMSLLHSITLAAIILADTFTTFMYLGIISGFVTGVTSALVQVIVIETMGVTRYASVIGLSAFLQALFTLPLPPFMGWIRDTSGNYLNVFLFLALLQLIVAIIWIIQSLVFTMSSKSTNSNI